MKTVIKNARVVDAYTDNKKDVLIINDKIIKIEDEIQDEADKIIDAQGLMLMPGFIDLHAHFRDPGYTYKEDLITGSQSAANGGYTFVNLMANTNPIIDTKALWMDTIKRGNEINIVGINQTFSLTKGLEGKELVDIEDLSEDVYILSDDGKDLLSNHMMYEACKICAKQNKTIMVHAEDSQISGYDYRVAEDLITIRDVYLCGVTNCHIHMSHVSTKSSIEAIRIGKSKGYNLTCEVTPHHISLSDMNYKVNPPIRSKEDVDEIIRAIKEGVVDAIATDHAPHTEDDKSNGSPGMIGLETSFAICNTFLVRKKHIDYKKLSEIMSYGGAKILRLNERGLIKQGYYADIVLVDPNKKIVVDKEKFKSKSTNSPFIGRELYGEVVMTLRNGKVIKDDNR